MQQLMKPAFVLLCVFGVLSFAGCATTAHRPITVEELFKRADKSGDGRVSRTEFEDFMIENMFASFDRNGDGFITEEEFLADGGTVKTFRQINVSGTGKITLEEAKSSKLIRNRLAAPFQEADVNGNGYVTWEEFQAARAKARAYVR
jgi:Ca2+-binding EF-hand superfamily protein